MTTHRSRPIYIQLALAVEWINNVFAAFLLIMAMIGTFPPSMSYTNNNIRRGTSGHGHGHGHSHSHGHSHGHGHGDTGSVEESYLGFAHWILDHKLLSKKFSGFGFASSGSGVAFGVYSAVFVLALAVVRYRKKMSSVSKIRAWV